ncbi:MAG: hypothetical protein JWN98_1309 [Abditibacteriota bacterium]|nr:hypothetical protein [Abditibacteriota bacterium]
MRDAVVRSAASRPEILDAAYSARLVGRPLALAACCAAWVLPLAAQQNGQALPPGESPTSIAPTSPALAPETPAPNALEESQAPGRLEADSIRYAGDTILLAAEPGRLVRLQSGPVLITAERIVVDVAKKTLNARGQVVIERTRMAERTVLEPRALRNRERGNRRVRRPSSLAPITERLSGSDLRFEYTTNKGELDAAQVRLEGFDVSAARIAINGQRYEAFDVLLRPGGLTDEELKIYGTPPFNLRAKRISLTSDVRDRRSANASGAALYFKNTKILPIPSFIIRAAGTQGPSRAPTAYTLSPRIAYNSADGLLASLRLRFPLAGNEGRVALYSDVGLSQRIGFRGGLSLESESARLGNIALRARVSDIVTTQLTNRIELNRTPEFEYVTPILPLLRFGNGYGIGVSALFNAGHYRERTIGSNAPAVRSSRVQNSIGLTTRIDDRDGPYLDIFRTSSRYGMTGQSYTNTGLEVGYTGQLLPRVRGLFSFRSIDLRGATPFRFDEVEIPREIRSTFDVELTPRYLVPIDLRYDLDRKEFRDKSIGLLRSYKTFAYGLTYQVARSEFKFEFRSGL